MTDIRHRIGIRSTSPAATYAALTEPDGLAAWWTEQTTGERDRLRFRFGDLGGFDMAVTGQEPGRSVAWQVVGGPDDWVGTRIRFDLEQQGDHTIVGFRHEGFADDAGCVPHCNMKWATFLLSLKALVENGEGRPWPRDVKIDEFN